MNGKKRRKRWKTGRLHWPGSDHGHHHPAEAERLKPLEEKREFKESPQTDSDREARDTIRVDSKSVTMPEHLLEDEREGSRIFRLEPVVVFILVAMLAFIAFVAWQITLMPPKQ
ncbi:MAG: hypothetical protein LC795_06515 [Acidobacteria bacterium]|nr:hypothetical protein [Acidobacteriota bacterium]